MTENIDYTTILEVDDIKVFIQLLINIKFIVIMI